MNELKTKVRRTTMRRNASEILQLRDNKQKKDGVNLPLLVNWSSLSKPTLRTESIPLCFFICYVGEMLLDKLYKKFLSQTTFLMRFPRIA